MEDLVTAFSHKLTMETNFYWKKATKRVVEVSIFDYALISSEKHSYDSGLDADEEREIKEAIIASEKNRDTHLFIPRLSVDERIDLMNEFISAQKDPAQKTTLQNTLNQLIELSQAKPINLLKNGFKMGFDLNDLTLNSKDLTQAWTEFFRAEIKYKVNQWLNVTSSL